ncbi:FecR domain-containing protein [Paenibacillus athensensis]|uniref:FecR protein domain-containing protein n=1 Tax=Paenibacillus athensensis TaxID=1967502 RepID=A0A4Y8Q9L1_9BACL|nr:FecR domain-containing protein [Paenibacillus athensensis]MCD1259088.1 FecR domain-containing protein [Paenibacillus athensensis]
MNLLLPNHRFNKTSFIALIMSFVIVFGLVSSVLAKPAQAKTVRLALVSSMSGTVTVKKGGGSKTYDAYTNMSLNQGDTIYTGSGSSVVLAVGDDDAEMTIGANSEFNISDLAGKDSGKKSKLKMWAGSMWVKVKSLAGSDDEFEVETPTAVMGVRGTHFFVGVDPKTGKTTMAVAAGKVSASTVTNSQNDQQEAKETFLYPTQQISLDSRDEVEDLSVKVEPIDIEEIVKQASPEVIEAIVKDKQSIDKENQEFVDKKKEQLNNNTPGTTNENTTFAVGSQDDLNKVSGNLDNLVGNFAKQAVSDKKVSKEKMDQIVSDANSKIGSDGKKLDLNNVKDLDKTAGLDPEKEKQRQVELAKAEAEKKKKQDEAAKKLADLQQKLNSVLKTVQEANKKAEEAKKQAEAEAKAKAEAELLKKLSDAEKAKYNSDKSKTPTPTPTPTPSSSGGGSSQQTTVLLSDYVSSITTASTYVHGHTEAGALVTVSAFSGSFKKTATAGTDGIFSVDLGTNLSLGTVVTITAQAPNKKVSAAVTRTVTAAVGGIKMTKETTGNGTINAVLTLKDFIGDSQIYAVEVHLVYWGDVNAVTSSGNTVTPINGTVFSYTGSPSVDSAKIYSGNGQTELVYAITSYGSANNVSVSGEKVLVKLPFTLNGMSGGIHMPEDGVIIVKKDGTRVPVDIYDNYITLATAPN